MLYLIILNPLKIAPQLLDVLNSSSDNVKEALQDLVQTLASTSEMTESMFNDNGPMSPSMSRCGNGCGDILVKGFWTNTQGTADALLLLVIFYQLLSKVLSLSVDKVHQPHPSNLSLSPGFSAPWPKWTNLTRLHRTSSSIISREWSLKPDSSSESLRYFGSVGAEYICIDKLLWRNSVSCSLSTFDCYKDIVPIY